VAPPKLFVQIQGQGSVSADQMNSTIQWCQTVTQLRSFIGQPTMTVFVQGINASDDGGQGFITDSAASPVFSSIAAGGGSLYAPIYSDGSAWRNG
jgi:hypothetical protein